MRRIVSLLQPAVQQRVDPDIGTPRAVGGVWLRGWAAWRPRSWSWWITLANLIGSIAFGVSAVVGYISPATGQLHNTERSNLGTLVGAVCFFAGALLLLPERTEEASPAVTTPAPLAVRESAAAALPTASPGWPVRIRTRKRVCKRDVVGRAETGKARPFHECARPPCAEISATG